MNTRICKVLYFLHTLFYEELLEQADYRRSCTYMATFSGLTVASSPPPPLSQYFAPFAQQVTMLFVHHTTVVATRLLPRRIQQFSPSGAILANDVHQRGSAITISSDYKLAAVTNRQSANTLHGRAALSKRGHYSGGISIAPTAVSQRLGHQISSWSGEVGGGVGVGAAGASEGTAAFIVGSPRAVAFSATTAAAPPACASVLPADVAPRDSPAVFPFKLAAVELLPVAPEGCGPSGFAVLSIYMTMYSVFVGIPRDISLSGQSWIVNTRCPIQHPANNHLRA